jgi:hypothetical protein
MVDPANHPDKLADYLLARAAGFGCTCSSWKAFRISSRDRVSRGCAGIAFCCRQIFSAFRRRLCSDVASEGPFVVRLWPTVIAFPPEAGRSWPPSPAPLSQSRRPDLLH